MTLLTFILSLALTFVCSSYEDCQNIRSIEYVYEKNVATSTDAVGIDYRITEEITFVDSTGKTELRETVYDFPYLQDRNIHDWQMAVNLLAKERGVEIKEFYNDNVAIGYIPERYLEAYKDIYKDGFVNDMDSFDYLDERELSEQKARYMVVYVSFSLFYMSAKMLNIIFKMFHKGKGV